MKHSRNHKHDYSDNRYDKRSDRKEIYHKGKRRPCENKKAKLTSYRFRRKGENSEHEKNSEEKILGENGETVMPDYNSECP